MKRHSFVETCFVTLLSLGNEGREEEDKPQDYTKGFPQEEVFLTGQRYENSLVQMDSAGFEERSTEKYREFSLLGKVEVSLRRKY